MEMERIAESGKTRHPLSSAGGRCGGVGRILLDESIIHTRLDGLAGQICSDYAGLDLTVVTILKGGLMFAADLLRRLDMPVHLDFLSVSSYQGTSSTGDVLFHHTRLPHVNGRHVLLLDDILDSGCSLHAILHTLRQKTHPLSIKTCVLLRKDVPRRHQITADYVGFDIPNEFVVGYGLDYKEHFRNLPYIGVYKEPVRRP